MLHVLQSIRISHITFHCVVFLYFSVIGTYVEISCLLVFLALSN